MRDGRYAVAFIAVVIYGSFYLINHLKPTVISNDSKLILKNLKIRLVVGFFTISYVVWETIFSIGRYAISLEILTGLLFLIGYKFCCAQFGSKLFLRVIVRAVAAIILIIIPFTSLSINWEHQQYSQSSLHPTFSFCQILTFAYPKILQFLFLENQLPILSRLSTHLDLFILE